MASWRSLLLACWLPLGGCAWLIGHSEPPQPKPPFETEVPTQRASLGPIRVSATYRGVGERLVSARNLLGRASVVVDPYGEDSLVFDLTIENQGSAPVVVLPESASLRMGERVPVPARTLADFRNRWPLWALRTPEEREHRAVAYNALMDTLLLERQIAPGASAAGRLAFPVSTPRETMTLTLPLRLEQARHEVALTWQLR